MPVGDIFEVRPIAIHTGGQTAEPTWFYRCTSLGTGTGISGDLSRAFDEDVLQNMIVVTENNWTWNRIEVVNLDDALDFDELLIVGGTGDLTGGSLPSVLAVAIRSKKQATAFNRSRHQLPLLDQASFGSDGSLSLTARDSLFFVQQALGTEVDRASNDATFEPVTVKKTYVDGVLTDVIVRAVVLGQWEVNRQFGTQKSRQDYLWELAEEPV